MAEGLPAKEKVSAARLRAIILNAKNTRVPRRLELEGAIYIISVPTVAEASEISAQAMKVIPKKKGDAEVKLDQGLQKALAAIAFVRDEDGAPVFFETDREALLAAQVGSPLERLAAAALEALNVDEEELEGNSVATG